MYKVKARKASSDESAVEIMKCSLWLLPPASVGNDLRVLIHELSCEGASVPFEPHVTIVGGIDCQDDPAQLCRNLQDALRGKFGNGIDCQVQPKAVSIRSDGGTVQWNQALVAVLDKTPSMLALVDASRKAFHLPPGPKFAPLLQNPHLSLYYGTCIDNIPDPDCVVVQQSFLATELALWKTEPGTPEGVAEWKEVGRISLI